MVLFVYFVVLIYVGFFKTIILLFYLSGSFAFRYVCVPQVCLVP